jgi:cytohesin
MWCKCQIDYLCTLPTDEDRRQALETLPPDLPATYIRILEIIDRDLAPKTTTLIKRALKWIATCNYTYNVLTLPALVHAISIDHNSPPKKLNVRAMPHEDDIIDWLGSLVRVNKAGNMLEFSHFTVKEFLESTPETVDSLVARQYLLRPNLDAAYLAQTCLAYLSLADFDFKHLVHNNMRLDVLCDQYPFYAHAAAKFPDYVCEAAGDIPDTVVLQRFFSLEATGPFASWAAFVVRNRYSIAGRDESWLFPLRPTWRPLHLAAFLLLSETVRRLLSQGATPAAATDYPASPLHLAISGPPRASEISTMELYEPDTIQPARMIDWDKSTVEKLVLQRVSVVQDLLRAGAEVNVLCRYKNKYSRRPELQLTPFTTAISYLHAEIAKILLESGADYTPTANGLGEEYSSLRRILAGLLTAIPDGPGCQVMEPRMLAFNETIGILLSLPEVDGVTRRSLAGRDAVEQVENDSNGIGSEGSTGQPLSNDVLMAAARTGSFELFDWAVLHDANLEARRHGHTAMCVAVRNEHSTIVAKLEERGASRFELCADGESPLVKAYRMGGFEYAASIFGIDSDLELSDAHRIEVLQDACSAENADLVEYMLVLGVDEAHEPCLTFDMDPPFAILRAAHDHGLVSRDYIRRAFAHAWHTGDRQVAQYLMTTGNVDDLFDETDVPKLTGETSEVFCEVARARVFNGPVWETLIEQAVNFDAIELQNLLITQSPGARWTDEKGNSLLHLACKNGDARVIELVLKTGVETDGENLDGLAPAHLAAIGHSQAALDLLVKYGADIASPDASNRTVLHFLLASLLAKYSVFSADHQAASLCSHLIEVGRVDPNVHENQNGGTALHQALSWNAAHTTTALLEGGSDPGSSDKLGYLPIHTAAWFGATDALLALMSSGLESTSPDTRSQRGWTALHVAAANGHSMTCKALLNAGAEINDTDPEGGTPLHLAACAGSNDTITTLLDAGAEIDRTTGRGLAAFSVAAQYGRCSAVLHLLGLRADPFVVDCDGLSALHQAARGGHTRVVSAMLKAGVFSDLNAQTHDGSTALHQAVFPSATTTRLLIEAGADVNVKDNSGATPLDLAVKHGNPGSQRHLRKAQARRSEDPGVRNSHKLACLAVSEGTNLKAAVGAPADAAESG